MARKTLLSEGEIRQFMKLANLTPLGHGRLEEFGFGAENPPLEEEEEEMAVAMDEEPPMDDVPMDDVPMDDEAPLDDEAPMDDLGADGAGMVSIDDFMTALESALEEVTGEPVSAEVDDDLGAEEELGDEEGMEMELGAEPDAGLPPEEEEEEPPGMRDMYEGKTEEEVVNEVAQRVVNRLKVSKGKQDMVEQLAEKIMSRLISK